MTAKGIVSAIVGYDMHIEKSFDQIIFQVGAAIQFIEKRFKNANIIVCGHSAGAHLALKG
jgi:acetyl esterase/lipase